MNGINCEASKIKSPHCFNLVVNIGANYLSVHVIVIFQFQVLNNNNKIIQTKRKENQK